ncbi:hypothetical protein DYB32_010683 [Aphanomyces invadans]|uniref:DUF6818 domain-containing protein n=1 Tax=Aphanomyces invadans TaxID=157072 RepID=A0A3R6VDH0_9STRA|nr:hypothetical protein DYB32_010683 [Aphanomyces invadans]
MKHKRSAPNWSDADVTLLLDCIQTLIPLGQNGWIKVSQVFNSNDTVSYARDWESCKRKFTFLKTTKKPTGEPGCPPHVVRAKRLQRDIDSRAAVEVLDDHGEIMMPDQISHVDPDIDRSPTEDVTLEQLGLDQDVVDSHVGVDVDDESMHGQGSEDGFAGRVKKQKLSLPEKTNRSGLSEDRLRSLGKKMAAGSMPSASPSSAASLSLVAKRRQSIDAFIDQASKQQTAGNDIMSLVLLMEERAQKRQEEREERDQLRDDERQRLREEREEREYQRQRVRDEREERNRREDAEQRLRHEQFQMTLLMKMFGDASK